MYHAHFGLTRGLFADGIAADAAVFRTPRHDRLIAQYKLALAAPTSCIVLQGPAGVGKTTLTSTALRATTTRLAIAWINGMATNAAELLELVLVELGVSTLRTTRIERLQLWRQFQGEMRATDSRLFIAAERTEDLTPEVLHALDQLTAPDAIGNPGANLVLLGHSGIREHLAAPLLDSLRQRIRLRAELEPFTEAELQDFLRHQVACAGGHYDRIFAPGTVGALYRYSGGVTRLATTLCESALDLAASDWQKQLTAEIVAKTATSLLGLTETAAAVQPAPVRVESPASAQPRTLSAPPAAATPSAQRPPEARAPAAPSPAPAPVPTAARPAPPPAPPAPPKALEAEYDGSATDVADVALADFPILTDAVETPLPAVASKPPPAPPKAAFIVPPLSAPAQAVTPVVTSPAAPNTAKAPATPAAAAKPAGRAEPAPLGSRPGPKPQTTAAPPSMGPGTPAPAPAPAAAAAQRPAPPKPPAQAAPPAAPAPSTRAAAPPPDPEAEDLLRQTQSMRAISVAKSIDDISEIDAETLFSDAELDLVAAALASAAEWADEEEDTVPAAQATPAKPVTAKHATAKTLPSDDDDLLGLLGLSDDSPLELIDDSANSNDRQRKTSAR